MGTLLINGAMQVRHDIGFSAYDRLFPNQDVMPKGGFGNLIALPLQGGPRRNGNSVFVDENFKEYPDQWQVLACVSRIDEEKLKEKVRVLSIYDEPVEQSILRTTESHDCRKQKSGLSAEDFPSIIRISCSNMIYTEKSGVSERALGAIKRMGVYANPEFFKAQKMRLPTYGKPRFICVCEEDDAYIAIPRGRLDRMRSLLKEAGAQFLLDDRRNGGEKIEVSFNGTLREEQQRAFSALMSRDTGVLSATTAFGKTVVGARMIAERKRNTLVLVHTSALLNQWKSALTKFLDFGYELPERKKTRGRRKELSYIGQLGAAKNTLNGKIDIAIMQSLGGKNGVKEIVKNYGLVIVDECHHIPAPMFEQVLKAVNAKYVYGLTATPVRADGREESIFMQCGDIAYQINAREQAEKQLFEHFTLPRFTDFRMPLAVDGGLKTLNRIFSELCVSKNRNKLIVDDVVKTVDCGRMPIVLTERSEHAKLLTDEIEKRGVKVFLLIGKESAALRCESDYILHENGSNISTTPFVKAFDECKIVTKKIKRLFYRTFVDGKNDPNLRPLAVEFVEAFDEAQDMLTTCETCRADAIFSLEEENFCWDCENRLGTRVVLGIFNKFAETNRDKLVAEILGDEPLAENGNDSAYQLVSTVLLDENQSRYLYLRHFERTSNRSRYFAKITLTDSISNTVRLQILDTTVISACYLIDRKARGTKIAVQDIRKAQEFNYECYDVLFDVMDSRVGKIQTIGRISRK